MEPKWMKNTGSRRRSRGSTQNKQKAEDREGVKGDSITIRWCMLCDKIPREMRTNIYLAPIGNWQNTKVKKPPKSNSLRLLTGIWVRLIYRNRCTPKLLHHKRPTPILVTIYDNWNSGADYITCFRNFLKLLSYLLLESSCSFLYHFLIHDELQRKLLYNGAIHANPEKRKFGVTENRRTSTEMGYHQKTKDN